MEPTKFGHFSKIFHLQGLIQICINIISNISNLETN